MEFLLYLAEKLDKKKKSMLCMTTERSFRIGYARLLVSGNWLPVSGCWCWEQVGTRYLILDDILTGT